MISGWRVSFEVALEQLLLRSQSPEDFYKRWDKHINFAEQQGRDSKLTARDIFHKHTVLTQRQLEILVRR